MTFTRRPQDINCWRTRQPRLWQLLSRPALRCWPVVFSAYSATAGGDEARPKRGSLGASSLWKWRGQLLNLLKSRELPRGSTLGSLSLTFILLFTQLGLADD